MTTKWHRRDAVNVSGLGWRSSCACGWVSDHFFQSWEKACADYEFEHAAKDRALTAQEEQRKRQYEEAKKAEERAEVQRRIEEIKTRYRKKK